MTRQLEIPLRVHIAHVGYEVQRVVEPLVELRADRVYLVTGDPEDTAKRYWREILGILKKDYRIIEVKEEFSDPWSFPQLLSLYSRIIREEKSRGNQVYVNISTGTKIAAMVGHLSAMLWGASPYYVQIAYNQTGIGAQPLTEVVTGIVTEIPVYRIEGPSNAELAILKSLAIGHPLTKKAIIANLRKEGFIAEAGRIKDPAAYGQLNALLRPLAMRGFLEIQGERKSALISITKPGRDAVILFQPSLSNSPPR